MNPLKKVNGKEQKNKDTAGQKRVDQKRESILTAVSFAAEQFLRSHNWQQPMAEVLARLGEAVGVSRVYIFENFIQDDGLMSAQMRYEWVAPGITPQLDVSILQNFCYETEGFDRWLVEMGQGRPIVGHVADFSPAEQSILGAQSILSLLAVPVFVGAEWWGFIGFDDCVTVRDWTEGEIESLRTAANILGAVIQRTAAETALRQSETMNRTLLESLPDVLFRVGANKRLLEAHGRDTIIAHLSRHQAFGLLLDDVVPLLPFPMQATGQRFVDIINQVQATGEPFLFEYKLTIEGRLVNFEARMLPHHNDEVLVLVRDITERKQSEEVLREAQKAESVGVLAGGIAHDFNNLLTGLMAQASLAQAKMAADSAARPHVEKILKITQRAADLTHQLLTYAGKTQARVEILDLNELIGQNVHLLETLLPPQSLHLELSAQPMMVWGDRGQLQQVIMNLILNAAEAIEGGGSGRVIIRTEWVEITATPSQDFYGNMTLVAGPYVCLQVIDNGVGIAEATLPHIFDPFFSTKTHGRGLGLSATLGIIRSQQGALQVESEVNSGTTFRVWLPIRFESEQPAGEAAPAAADGLAGSVLVVDDERPVREAVVDILQTLGLQTWTAANGQIGLALFERHRSEIAAVLLDMQMPVMNGIETLRHIRRLDKQVPVILSSGYSEAEMTSHLQDGATTFLQKPYDMDRLIEAVTAVIKK